ncbi:hypothetical protein D918_05181 [Trichuris suis]|nr:hypothetical protein D918_05181 [Trichuris suis]
MFVSCGVMFADTAETSITDSSPDEQYFIKLDKSETAGAQARTADGSVASAAGKGSITVKLSRIKGPLEKFVAHNTLFVPGIKHGVLSVRQMVENNRRIIFDKRGCHIYDLRGNLLIEASPPGRLYVATACRERTEVEKKSFEVADCNEISIDQWHKRMMHVRKERILQMAGYKAVRGLRCSANKPSPCEDCLKRKSSRVPFRLGPSAEQNVKSRPLDLVHCDLIGRMHTCSSREARYILTVIDDATRYVSVRFLKNKGSVPGKFKQWLSEAERQSSGILKRIRTDNCLQFFSRAWETFCSTQEIVHERTMVYTPQ